MVQILQETGPEGGGRGSSEATRLRLASPGWPRPHALRSACSRLETHWPAGLLSRSFSLFAASCVSYNFSFLSPQGLSSASQGSSAPFWSGTAGARGVGGPGLPPAGPQPLPQAVRSCPQPSAGRGRAAVAPRPGKGGPAARVGLRMMSGLASSYPPIAVASRTRAPCWPLPSLAATVPPCLLRALPPVAANSRAATLGVKTGADRASPTGRALEVGGRGVSQL